LPRFAAGWPVAYASGKVDINEFVKWLSEMPNSVDPALVNLYYRAQLCKAFPAYTLESARHANAREVFVAFELLNLAAKLAE